MRSQKNIGILACLLFLFLLLPYSKPVHADVFDRTYRVEEPIDSIELRINWMDNKIDKDWYKKPEVEMTLSGFYRIFRDEVYIDPVDIVLKTSGVQDGFIFSNLISLRDNTRCKGIDCFDEVQKAGNNWIVTIKAPEGYRIIPWRPDYAGSDDYTIVDGIKKYTEFNFYARTLMVSSRGKTGILPVILVADDYVPKSTFSFRVVNGNYWTGVPGIKVRLSGTTDFGDTIDITGVTDDKGNAVFPDLARRDYIHNIAPGDYSFIVMGNEEYKIVPERAEYKVHFWEGKDYPYVGYEPAPVIKLSDLAVKNESTAADDEKTFKLELKSDPYFADGALAFTEGKWKKYDSSNNEIESGKIRDYTDYYYSLDVKEDLDWDELAGGYILSLLEGVDSNDGKLQHHRDLNGELNGLIDLMFLRSSGRTDFTLKSGETIVFMDLPEDVEYTIISMDSEDTKTGRIIAGQTNEVRF